MVYERVWDETCPRVWDSWEANGKLWVIQDLDPADYAEAVDIMVYNLCPDETMCTACKLLDDPDSVAGIRKSWTEFFARRMSLGCYMVVDGKRTLVALNACAVFCKDDHAPSKVEGERWRNVCEAMEYMESKSDAYEYVGTDKLLHALGLVVRREYRGARLGGKLLAAREPLCRAYGIKGTTTIFTGPASQKLAASCGFETIYEITLSQLADAGFNYPREDKVLKLMVKKYE